MKAPAAESKLMDHSIVGRTMVSIVGRSTPRNGVGVHLSSAPDLRITCKRRIAVDVTAQSSPAGLRSLRMAAVCLISSSASIASMMPAAR